MKANKDDFCFISSDIMFQIFGPEYEMVSCLFHTVFAHGWWNWKPLLKLQLIFEKEKSSGTIVGAILLTTLYIKIASAWIYFDVLSQSYLFEVVLGNHLGDHNISALSCELLIFCLMICCDSSIWGNSN